MARWEYSSVVFLQGDDYDQARAEIDAAAGTDWTNTLEWTDAALAYCMQWEYGDVGEVYDTDPHGSEDEVFSFPGYTLAVNTRMGYIGLTRITPGTKN